MYGDLLPGDRVRKRNGLPFAHGDYEDTVASIRTFSSVHLQESGSWMYLSDLVLCKKEVEGEDTFNRCCDCDCGEPCDKQPEAPSTNPKDIIGQTKPAISCVPPVALFHIGQAMADGKEKYGLMNWREHPVKASVYYDAALRHLMSWWDGEQRASDSNVHHLAHAAACMCILLDAESGGNLVDDKPLKGMLAEFIKANTKG